MAAVAQSHVQDDVHPLLRHPRPIKRDPATAQRMLSMIADSDDVLKSIHREKSITTRWLERPMYGDSNVSGVEKEREHPKVQPVVLKEEAPTEKSREESDFDLLDKWTNPDRPTSSFNPEETLKKLVPEPDTNIDASSMRKRPQPLTRPASYNAQHLLSPDWTASPATLSPQTTSQRPASSYLESLDKTRGGISSRGSCECEHTQIHPIAYSYPPAQQTTEARKERPASYQPQSFTCLDSPPLQPRPRPTSYATYQPRVRSGGKIASSRGLRNNSYPNNLAKPMSGNAAKAIAGENIENDMVYQRFGDDEVGPPTPATSGAPTFSPPPAWSVASGTPINTSRNVFEQFEEKSKPEKKAKHRWSTIPQALKNFSAKRRESAATQDQPKFAMVVDDLQRMNLTAENLQHYEVVSSRDPTTPKRMSTVDLIPTPTYSPSEIPPTLLDAPLPAPFAPWANAPPSPAATADRRRSSGNHPLTLNTMSSGLSVEATSQARPVSWHSRRSSIIAVPSSNVTWTAPQLRNTKDVTISPRATPPSSRPCSRRNTPAIERTCILCKTSRPIYEFVQRRITANCWHEPATCAGCMQGWLRQCVDLNGWGGCSCPECGEKMASEDIAAFAEVSPL
ncbi:zinc ion binding [Pyrenophora seminiperda CCB06]|uniref:Zinc ion binding n=1 Tax=Pyrenophora seminiperda CCB06 TaxID=1302712 RepID=A0A3M7LXP2_9PLEO|nr:zinc ion binding [Pyrenophora seminiperda CCB06]